MVSWCNLLSARNRDIPWCWWQCRSASTCVSWWPAPWWSQTDPLRSCFHQHSQSMETKKCDPPLCSVKEIDPAIVSLFHTIKSTFFQISSVHFPWCQFFHLTTDHSQHARQSWNRPALANSHIWKSVPGNTGFPLTSTIPQDPELIHGVQNYPPGGQHASLPRFFPSHL